MLKKKKQRIFYQGMMWSDDLSVLKEKRPVSGGSQWEQSNYTQGQYKRLTSVLTDSNPFSGVY